MADLSSLNKESLQGLNYADLVGIARQVNTENPDANLKLVGVRKNDLLESILPYIAASPSTEEAVEAPVAEEATEEVAEEVATEEVVEEVATEEEAPAAPKAKKPKKEKKEKKPRQPRVMDAPTAEQQAILDDLAESIADTETRVNYSDTIRKLHKKGMAVKAIAHYTGRNYAFVYGVVQRLKKSLETPAAPVEPAQ